MSADVKAAHRELTGAVMGRPGVEGTAVGERGGEPCLIVYVSDAAAGRTVPKRVRGVRVVVEKSGGFRRL